MKKVSIDTENKGLHIISILNAPIGKVWEAWTNPDAIASWWGPDGFTNTIHQMDLVLGGEWRLNMNWTMLFETTELFETVVKVFKTDESLNQNVVKLRSYLDKKTVANKQIE